jgi:hypothetical protein
LSHRHAEAQRRAIWPPEPGFFVVGLARGAWRVPARLIHDSSGWHAEVDETVHPAHRDPVHAPMVDTVWHHGMRVPEADFRWLLATKAHAKIHDPEHPSLWPRRKIDPRRLKPIQHEGIPA